MPSILDLLPQVQSPQEHASPLAPDNAAMDRFLSYCQIKRYPNRSDIFRPGDAADKLYYVVQGSLSVVSEEGEGKELTLGYIKPGEFIGEMGLFFSAQKRSVLLRSRTPCELAEIPYDEMVRLFTGPLKEESPKIMYAIGTQLSRRLLETSRKASSLAFKDVTSRIARALLDLCNEPDAMSHPKGTQIKVSRQEIARLVGCSREVAGRILKQLQEQDMISARGKTVVVFGTRG